MEDHLLFVGEEVEAGQHSYLAEGGQPDEQGQEVNFGSEMVVAWAADVGPPSARPQCPHFFPQSRR